MGASVRPQKAAKAKELRLLTRAAEGGPACFDPFLVLQLEATRTLSSARVSAAYEDKLRVAATAAARSDDAAADCPVTQVVRAAHALLSDPVTLQACVACVEAAAAAAPPPLQRRGGGGRGGGAAAAAAEEEEREERLLANFRTLLARLGGSSPVSAALAPQALPEERQRATTPPAEGDEEEGAGGVAAGAAAAAAARADRRKQRKNALRAYQQQQKEREDDALEFGGGARRSAAAVAAAAAAAAAATSTPPRSPVSPSLPAHVTDAGAVRGSAAALLRQACALACVARRTATLAGVDRAACLAAADEAALRTLETLGACAAAPSVVGGADVLSVTGWPAGATAGRGRLSGGGAVEAAGSVGQAALWLLAPLCFAPRRTTLTLRGQTDAGALPVAAVAEGCCPLLRLFGGRATLATERRRGGAQSTATLVCGGGDAGARPAPVQLTEAGPLSEVSVSVWVSKGIPLGMGQKIAQAALSCLEKKGPPGAASMAKLDLVKEDGLDADVSGVSVVLRSVHGGVWCGWSSGGRAAKAEHTGERAASAALADYKRGGCVSDYLQEHAAVLMAGCPPGSPPSRLLVNLPLSAHLQATMALVHRTCPNVKFTTAVPPARENGKNTTILECSVAAEVAEEEEEEEET